MHGPRLLALVGALTLLLAPLARAANGGVVVSQVYAGGGTTGAAYANDFVELLNTGGAAVDVSGWTVQYASAASTSWQSTPLSGSIQPGHYYLVQLASSGAVGAALPTADATGTANLASAGGKVALVRDATALTCGASAGSCGTASTIADLVGWGTAADYEGAAAAPALSSTTAAVRGGAGCTDTGSNAADFTAAAPAPRSSATTAAACAGATSTGTTGDVAVAADVEPLVSIGLDHPSLDFGQLVPGQTPAALPEHVTIVSNDAAGYSLTVHRTAFAPADLPLGIAVAPASALAAIPVVPAADLLLGSASTATAAAGDVWSLSLGLTAPTPVVGSGHYTATVTFTVIPR